MTKHIEHEGLTYDDVLIVPAFSTVPSRSEVLLDGLFGDYPIIPANMSTCTGENMAEFMLSKQGTAILHRYMSDEELIRLATKFGNKVFYSVGSTVKEYDRIVKLIELGITEFCVDLAHGHSKNCGSIIDVIRRERKDVTIIAGNVATLEGVLYLKECGADIVKVGVGPGSVCTTRTQTGVGVPQLTALLECSKANVPLIADGGFKYPGDLAKALAIDNVEGVMTGSLFAGTDMTPDWKDGATTTYAGMASYAAQKEFKGEAKNIEGESYDINCKPVGSTEKALNDMLDGIRSAFSYVGAYSLTEFKQKARLIRVSSHTTLENNPHFKSWNK